MKECVRIEADSTNGRQQEAWDDVTNISSSTKQQYQPTHSSHLSTVMLNVQLK